MKWITTEPVISETYDREVGGEGEQEQAYFLRFINIQHNNLKKQREVW